MKSISITGGLKIGRDPVVTRYTEDQTFLVDRPRLMA